MNSNVQTIATTREIRECKSRTASIGSRENWRRLIVVAIVTASAVSFMTVAQALPRAAAKRPAGVPEGYAITPFGYFHPSCVTQLAKGDVLHHDEQTIERANGAINNIQACPYAHYRADGEKVIGDERGLKQPDIGHAWVEWASVTTASSYGMINAFWNVPPAPATNDGQTVFLFNGMEDLNDVVSIIQPVLGWNSDYASAWGIASWNCCVNGNVYEATPKPVNSGDLILGTISSTCSAGTESCSTWDILTRDLTSGEFSELVNTSNYGQIFNWAFGGVLEVYNIVQCGDYPNDGPGSNHGPAIHFYNQELFNDNFAQIVKPNWEIGTASGLTPSCQYGGSLPEEVILTY